MEACQICKQVAALEPEEISTDKVKYVRIYISKNEAIRVSFLIESQVIWGFFIS